MTRQRQPAPAVSAGPLDLAERERDVARDRNGLASHFEPGDGRFAGRKDNAGRENSEWVEGELDPAEQPDDLVAVHPLEQSGPEPAVAVFARGRAAEPEHRVGDFL